MVAYEIGLDKIYPFFVESWVRGQGQGTCLVFLLPVHMVDVLKNLHIFYGSNWAM